MEQQELGIAILWYLAFVVSLALHEGAHAFVANWWGDETGAEQGLLTINPIPHIKREPFGALILPLFLLISSGGTMFMGYGHCPIQPTQMRNPKWGMITTAAAGPFSNVILAIFSFGILFLLPELGLGAPHIAYRFFLILLFLNSLLFMFNLLPIPPLDGSAIVKYLLPLELAVKYAQFEKYAIILFILLFITPAFGIIFGIPLLIIMNPFEGYRELIWP